MVTQVIKFTAVAQIPVLELGLMFTDGAPKLIGTPEEMNEQIAKLYAEIQATIEKEEQEKSVSITQSFPELYMSGHPDGGFALVMQIIGTRA